MSGCSTRRIPRRFVLGAIAAFALARGVSAAPSAGPLTLLRPQPGGETAASLAWRVCPGAEGSALVLAALPAAGRPAVTLRFSRPMAGCQVTSEVMPGPNGRHLLLVRLKVPSGARPGRYEGLLVVRCGPSASRLRLAAEVQPFELMRPSKQYAVSRVPVTAADWRVPERADAGALRRLREIGIGALCLDAAPADRSALESMMQTAGLRGPVLTPVEPSPTRRPSPVSAAAPIRWYAWCAAGPPAPAALAALQAGGVRVACPLDDPEAVSGVDLPVFAAGGACGARLLRRDHPPGPGTAGWWRWDAGAATALENRLRCGALLWKSSLSGALVEISPDAPARPDWPLRWEGVREGVLDSRCLTTLFALIRQVKDKDRSSLLPGKAEVAAAAALNRIVEHPSLEAADRLRALVITWILRLGRMVWS